MVYLPQDDATTIRNTPAQQAQRKSPKTPEKTVFSGWKWISG